MALSLTSQKQIAVMSLRNGTTLTIFTPRRTDIIVMAVALCKTKLAYTMGDGEVYLCDIFGNPYHNEKYTNVPGRPSCMCYSRDCENLVIGYTALVKSYNSLQSVHVIDVASGKLKCTLPIADACVDMKIHGDIVSVWTGESYSRWSISTGKQLMSFKPETAKTGRSCLSQDGRYILIARDASVSEVWDSEERRCLRTIKLPALGLDPGAITTGEIRDVAFPEGKVLISGANGVFGYEFAGSQSRADWMLCVISDYKKTAMAEAEFEALLDSARKAAASDTKKALRLIADARKVKGFENHPKALDLKNEIYAAKPKGVSTIANVFQRAVVNGNVTSMDMDEAGRYCGAIVNGRVKFYELPGFNEVQDIEFPSPFELSISGDGRYLLIASEDRGIIGSYDTAKRDFAWMQRLGINEVCTCDCNYDGSLGLLQYDMCSLYVFDLATGDGLYNKKESKLSFNKVSFTPDGKHIAAASNGGKGTEYNDLEIYSANDFTLTERIVGAAKGGMNGEAFPRQTQLVFTSSWDRHIYLSDRRSNRREGLQWHDYAPSAICAMADGSHIFSGDQEGIICMQRVLPEPGYDFTLHSEVPADRIRLTENGRYMSVMSYGRQIAFYELDLDYTLSELSDILARLEAEAKRKTS